MPIRIQSPTQASSLNGESGHLRQQACQERAALCGAFLAGRGFVFSFDVDGTRPWRPDTVTHRFSRLRKKVGLPAARKAKSRLS